MRILPLISPLSMTSHLKQSDLKHVTFLETLSKASRERERESITPEASASHFSERKFFSIFPSFTSFLLIRLKMCCFQAFFSTFLFFQHSQPEEALVHVLFVMVNQVQLKSEKFLSIRNPPNYVK